MVNPYDLKVLERFVPWANRSDASALPGPQKVSVDLLREINEFAVRESRWELRLWTLRSGAKLDDSHYALFAQAWKRANRFERDPLEFLGGSLREEPFEAQVAYIETSREADHNYSLIASLSPSRIAAVWFSISLERRYALVDFVELDQEVASWILDNAVERFSNPLRLVPYVRGTRELNELVDRIEVSSVYEAAMVMESQHFQLETAIKILAQLEPGEAGAVYSLLVEKYSEIAGSLSDVVGSPTPIDSDAPAALALEAKRVGRRRNVALEDIINAEVPYRIYAKPYKALQAKIAKQDDLNEIEVAVLEATYEHLLGLEILKKFTQDD